MLFRAGEACRPMLHQRGCRAALAMTSSASSAAGRCYDARNNAEANDELKTLQVSFCSSSCSRRPNSGIGSCVCLGSAGSGSDGGTGGCADPATHAGGHTDGHAYGFASDAHCHAGSDRAASAAHEHAGADVHAATEAYGYARADTDANAEPYTHAASHQHAGAAEPDCGFRERAVDRGE